MNFILSHANRLCCLMALATSTIASGATGQPGTLDTTFNVTGKVMTDVATGDNSAFTAASQADGRIVVAGSCVISASSTFCAVRYNVDGSLDASFGNSGKVTTQVAAYERLYALAIQSDGKLVMAGTCVVGSASGFCARRYNSDGSPDNPFGGGGTGLAFVQMGSATAVAYALAVQPNGKLLLAGSCAGASNMDFCTLSLNADGSVDANFGTGGKVISSISTQGSGIDRPSAVALQADGKVVVAGVCEGASIGDFCVIRYTPSGSMDTTFNGTGWRQIHVGSAGLGGGATAVVVQPDGKLVLAGNCADSDDAGNFCALRLNVDGSLDLDFNGTGSVISSPTANADHARAMALQPDGKLLLAGQCSDSTVCVLRLHSDGRLDTTWNGTGTTSTPVGPGVGDARAIVLQPDGKVVLAGFCDAGTFYNFCAVRYDGGPFASPACNLDIDGDGQLISTVDSLLHARISLGMTGNAVTNGIAFPAAAKRTTWTQIRSHLNAWCGTSLAP